MNKLFVSGLVLVFSVAFVVSQTPDQHGHGGAGTNGGMMGGGMMMGTDSSGMCTMMGMGMMMPRQIIPVDGGIVVVMGNKLIKFDKNLEKKKEVTIEMDEESMRQMLEQMQQMRSMMQGMMQSPAPRQEEGK